MEHHPDSPHNTRSMYESMTTFELLRMYWAFQQELLENPHDERAIRLCYSRIDLVLAIMAERTNAERARAFARFYLGMMFGCVVLGMNETERAEFRQLMVEADAVSPVCINCLARLGVFIGSRGDLFSCTRPRCELAGIEFTIDEWLELAEVDLGIARYA
jgi:hypothetical protein